MSINKVVYDAKVLIDLTEDSINAEDLVKGVTAHNKKGEPITGTMPSVHDILGTYGTVTPSTMRGETGYTEVAIITTPKDNISLRDSFSNDVTYGMIPQNGVNLRTIVEADKFGDAEASDVTKDKTFTSAAGVKVSGTMAEAKKFQCVSFELSEETSDSGTKYINFTPRSGYPHFSPAADSNVDLSKCYIAKAADLVYNLETNASDFGNATAADVAAGKTFTSAAGVRVNGSLKNITEVTGGGSGAKLSTSNRYINGVSQKCIDITSTSGSLNLSTTSISTGIVKDKSNLKVIGTAPCTSFGDATAADVAAGKTFTSAAGLKVKGTNTGNGTFNTQSKTITPKATDQTVYPDSGYNGLSSVAVKGDSNLIASNIKSGVRIFGITGTYSGSGSGGSSNNNVEAYLVDATNPAVSFKTTTGTIKVYGYATASTTSQWGGSQTTQYSFDGDGYYMSKLYGTPTKTSCTFGVSNGKLTGLPTLNGGTLLVVRGL